MNTLYVVATAITVSLDSFIVGFSLSLNQRKNFVLPLTVALVTYLMCLLVGLAGYILQDYLQNYVNYIGGTIMLCLGIANLIKKSEEPKSANFLQCLSIGISVGLDGATAMLSVTLQNVSDIILVPIIFATTHYFAVFVGQHLARNIKITYTNIIASIMFFLLAAVKFLGL